MTHAVPGPATTEQLTKIMRHVGVLGEEHVTDVSLESERHTLLWTVMRLRFTYAGRASASLPPSVFFKTRRQGSTVTFEESGRREVEFYAPRGLANARRSPASNIRLFATGLL